MKRETNLRILTSSTGTTVTVLSTHTNAEGKVGYNIDYNPTKPEFAHHRGTYFARIITDPKDGREKYECLIRYDDTTAE